MAKTKKTSSHSHEEILDEIKQLSERAKETSSHQLGLIPNEDLGDEDIDIGFDVSRLKDTADPNESYRLYYGMRRLLMDNLPRGKKNKRLRPIKYATVRRGQRENRTTVARGHTITIAKYIGAWEWENL